MNPAKLTKSLIKEFCSHLKVGHSLESAAMFVGVNSASVRNWMRYGKDNAGICREFFNTVKATQNEIANKKIRTQKDALRKKVSALQKQIMALEVKQKALQTQYPTMPATGGEPLLKRLKAPNNKRNHRYI